MCLINIIMVLNIKIKKVGPQDNKYLHLHVLCWRAFVHENHRTGMVVGKRRKRTWLRSLWGRPARDSSDSTVSHCDHSDTFINCSYSELMVSLFQQHYWDQEQSRGFSSWLKSMKPNHYARCASLTSPTCPTWTRAKQPRIQGAHVGLTNQGISSFFPKPHLPISRFLSLVVQSWKNSVIRLSNALREASSDAWQRDLRKISNCSALSAFQLLSTTRVICFPKHLGSTFFKCIMQARKIGKFPSGLEANFSISYKYMPCNFNYLC